jgi:hypothetical protein
MKSPTDQCSLLGLRLAPLMQQRIEQVLRDVLLLPQLQLPARDGRILPVRQRFRSGTQWIETSSDAVYPPAPEGLRSEDELHWHCGDLLQYRQHLGRLGIGTLDAESMEGLPCLRVASLDTGACAMVLRDEAQPAGLDPTAPPSSSKLVGIDMPVRTPERVSAHWAQILCLSNERSAGVPCLLSADVVLRFLHIDGDDHAMWSLDFAMAEPGAACNRANAHGYSTDAAGTGFHAEGMHFRLVPI